MKGTIDVQIKHKDGSTETRHEHNVVFDLQALATQYFYSREYGPLTGSLSHKYISSNTYSKFSLSTLELDLTKPSVAIPALNSISSGSSSAWYTAPITLTSSDKYRISSATWTAGEAITLKSIFFNNDDLFFAYDSAYNTYSSEMKCILCDDGFFYGSSCVRRMLSPSQNFKFTNTFLNGFSKVNYDDSSVNTPSAEVAFVSYKLHDPTERFLFVTTSSSSSYSDYYPRYSTGEIQIKDSATNTVKRSFNLSQFADFVTGSLRYLTRVVNTGSKNLLLQPVSTTAGIRVWEIPDTATEETIQPSGMILVGNDVYVSTSSSPAYSSFSVVDNVLMYCKQSNTSKIVCAKINDDLSVDIVPGANAAGQTTSRGISNEYNAVIWPYMNTSSPFLRRDSTSSKDTFNNYGTYSCRFFNSTAANFSTPIVLAEGDVLTVSYKIEVA